MFEANNSGLYLDDRKSGLRFFDTQGNADEVALKNHFNEFVNTYINDLVNDAHADVLMMGESFFSIIEKSTLGTSPTDTKTNRRELKLNMINNDSAEAMRSLFNTHVGVITPEGQRDSVTTRNSRIEKKHSKPALMKKGMTEQEADMYLVEAEEARNIDIKQSTYAELQLKYLVADMALNNSIFLGTMFQTMMDPAIFEKANDYKTFRPDFEKRMKGPVSPGEVSFFDKSETVKVLAFEDLVLGHIVAPLDRTGVSKKDNDFLDEFAKRFNILDDFFPTRIYDLKTVYDSRPDDVKERAWKDIASLMKSKITDGGSYITKREWLYRLYRSGKITSNEYFDYMNSRSPIPAKVMKYVYGGNNIVDTGNSSSNVYSYIKHAEIPLIRGVHANTALDLIANQLEEIERREYAGVTDGKPTPGLVLVPRSSFKAGVTTNTNLFNRDGSISNELLTTKVFDLNRGWLREQISSPDDGNKRSIISTQANILADLDTPGIYRFGQRGNITFSNMQESGEMMEYDNEDDESSKAIPIAGVSNGISSGVLQNAVISIFTELAERRFQNKIRTMGLNKTDEEYEVRSISKFISRIKEQAISRFGVGASAVDYLTVLTDLDTEKEVLSIPISFTPATSRMQSVFLSEIKEMFYRFTLPGAALSQFSAAGLYKVDKNKLVAKSELKSYRTVINTSAKYETEEEALKHFQPVEIHTPYNPVTKTLEYKTFTPAEAVVPWIFRDKNGKLLKYETYVNADGTPKLDMIDERLLDFVAFRIPNTGPNASAKLRVVKFMHPDMGDGIATAQEVVAILGADFDYDKLYSYFYNFNTLSNGKLVKTESLIHANQNNAEDFFVSDNQKREYARRQLGITNDRYRVLRDDKAALDSGLVDMEQQFHKELKDAGSMDFADFVELRNKVSGLDGKAIDAELKIIEDEFIHTDEFDKEYRRASVYQKQSVRSLENALIDRFHLMLGDFKTLQQMTTPLTSDWLSEQVSDKSIVYYEGTTRKTASIEELLHDKKFHSITSYNSFLQSRLSNATAGSIIAMGAKSLISQYQGQRFNFSLNSLAYPEEVVNAYNPLFKNSKGEIKDEDPVNSTNSTHSGFYSPYTIRKGDVVIQAPFSLGRSRMDRIFVIADSGERMNVSVALKAVLQAALDHQKNPLVDKAFITPHTFNALAGMIRLGYIDEAIPLLQQESVFDYVQGISGYYKLEANEYRTAVMRQIVSQYAGQYGITEDQVFDLYSNLPANHKNGAVLIDKILGMIPQVENNNDILSTKDLLFGIAQRAGVAPKDIEYGIRQLSALRNYLASEVIGKQLLTIEQGTNAYSSGLKPSFAELDLQNRRFKALHSYNKKKKQIVSSAPLITGIHRMSLYWSSYMGRKFDYKSSMMGYGQFKGVKPTLDLLDSLEGNVFTEFSPIFKGVRTKFFLTSMGININKNLESLSNSEYARVFNKINTNLVSFFYSNPYLYRNLFDNDMVEFEAFMSNGLEMLTKPRKDLPYNERFELFNNAESLAKTVELVSKSINPVTGNEYGIDYDILAAIKSIFNVSAKTPSSVVYMTASGYQDNQSHRIGMSIAAMYESTDPKLKSLAKKLLIYGFMTGGVTTPTSYIQFIPPSILRKMGLDTILRNTLEVSQRKDHLNDVINTFIVQYFQHHPFELQREIEVDKQLLHTDSGYLFFDKEIDRPVVQINPLEKKWFENKFIFRIGHKIFVHHPYDKKYLMQIDNLGMNKRHRNEFKFNYAGIPGTSLYLHNISESSRAITTGLEIGGEFVEEAVLDTEVTRTLKQLETPMFDKMVEKPESLGKVIEAIQMDDTNSTASGALSFIKTLVGKAKVVYEPGHEMIRGQYDPATGNIIINPLYSGFKGISTGLPSDFNNFKFAETIAHEATHMVTAETIEKVMTGVEKDPAKKNAVERLVKLREKVMAFIALNPEMRARHEDIVRYSQIMDKIIAGRKPSAIDSKFLKNVSHFGGYYTVDPTQDPKLTAIRQVQEFIAYAFSSAEFQEDLNNIDFRKGVSFWKELLNAIMNMLGLKIDEDQALEEVQNIKNKLAPRQAYVNRSGVRDSKTNELSEVMKDLQPYSALHVALREIIALGVAYKTDLKNSFGFGSSVGKVNMEDMYTGVTNFNPGWSQELKEIYHSATLNNQIIC